MWAGTLHVVENAMPTWRMSAGSRAFREPRYYHSNVRRMPRGARAAQASASARGPSPLRARNERAELTVHVLIFLDTPGASAGVEPGH
eukprot:COSAG02_NODE_1567_length_11900_cov_6.050250_6_plen_88_part_00